MECLDNEWKIGVIKLLFNEEFIPTSFSQSHGDDDSVEVKILFRKRYNYG